MTLNQVRVENTRNSAVFINNVSSAGAGTGAVTVSGLTILNTWGDSDVSDIWNGGLYITSRNPVSINGLYINNTDGIGAVIEHGGVSVTIKNGYIGRSKNFTTSSGDVPGIGLYIVGNSQLGPVTLDNLRLYNNKDDGIYISKAGAVKINNVYSEQSNSGYGLHVGDADPLSQATSVNITNSMFDGNYAGQVLKVKGPVTVSSSTFNYSEGSPAIGLDINNTALAGAPVTLKNVTVRDSDGEGIKIVSKGNVTFTGVDAGSNNMTGAFIDLTGGSGIATILQGSFSANGSAGLEIRSLRNIVLGDVTATDNGNSGVILNNGLGTGSVTVKASETDWVGFTHNTGSGLEITSNGIVALTNVIAYYNGQYGAVIDNTGGPGAVSMLATGIYGSNSFYGNNGTGLKITTKGIVTLTNVTASSNKNYGADIDNTGGLGGVSLLAAGTYGGNSFSYNQWSGLKVRTRGNITLVNIDASSNKADGVDLDNCLGVGDGP